jgi:aspartate kinase
MTTDPHEMDDARLIPRMNYQEVSEMAFFGARILHTRMAYPLIEPKIPFRVKNVFKPQQPGTLVDGIGQGSQPKAVTVIQGIGLFTDRSGPTNNVSALINDTLQVAIGSRSEFTFISQAAQRSFFCFVIPTSSNPNVFDEAMQKIEQALNALAPSLFAWQLIPVNVITVVGAQLTNNLAQLAAIFTALAPLSILAVSQSPAQCSFSVVVTAEHSEAAHHKLHQWVLGQP